MAPGVIGLDVVRIVAGGLILAVGAFVLAAKPHARLHQLFFLLALADGASTILFGLSSMSADTTTGLLTQGLYWYAFIAFVALLAAFGFVFPVWHRPPWTRALAVALPIVGGAVLVVAYVVDHAAFWSLDDRPGAYPIAVGPLGNAVNALFIGATAVVIARATRAVLRESSRSHRRQAAFVLGGMMLAFVPYPATLVAQALVTDPTAAFLAARPDRLAVYWASALIAISTLASAALLIGRRREESLSERRFVLSCLGGVLALGALTLAMPVGGVPAMLRSLALLAYPLLLGYAIARYEVFDIDRKVRRAATVTLVAGALTVAFLAAENAVEGLLQDRVLGGIGSRSVAGTAAAVAAAALFVPAIRASRKLAVRILPELTLDELHRRKLEIYRHSLAGAYADGLVAAGESRTLHALRSSLGITQEEHDHLVREVTSG